MGTVRDRWTRRTFLHAGAGAVVVAATARHARALPTDGFTGFAFVGSRKNRIHTFHVSDGMWRPVHEIAAEPVGHLVVHPTLPVLYVTHDVAMWDNFPRGAVSAFRLDVDRAQLVPIGIQPLSLSATYPRHAAVTADGHSLVVLAEGGGIYNALPVTADGSLLPVTAIHKEYGRLDGAVTTSSTPRYVACRVDGSMLAADSGKGTLSLFQLTQGSLTTQHRLPVHGSAGPRQVVLSTCGRWAYALHSEDASISVHSIDARRIGPAHQVVAGLAGNASMLVSPCGRDLIRADTHSIVAFAIDPQTGRLAGPFASRAARLQGMTVTPDAKQVVGFDPHSEQIIALSISADVHVLGTPRVVASVPGRASLAFLPV